MAPFLQLAGKLADAFLAAGIQFADAGGALQGLVEVDPGLGGEGEQTVDGGLADAAGRLVDDAQKVFGIGGIGKYGQIGQEVLDLLALVKMQAANDGVGDFVLEEGVFEHAGLGVGAVQDGDPAPGQPTLMQVQHTLRHLFGFIGIITADEQFRSLAGAKFRPQVFAVAAAVVADDGVGEF